MPEPSLYPASLPIEREILALMMEDGKILSACLAEGLKEHDFSLTDHRKVFAVICKLQAAGEPVNSLLVADKVGDLLLISSLMESGPVIVASHASSYVRLLAKKRRLRILAKVAEWILQEAVKSDADPDHIAEIVRVKIGRGKDKS